MSKACRKMYTDSGILVLEPGQRLIQRWHTLHMHDMVSVLLKLTIFQWAGQFFIPTSDLTPEIPG